MTVSLLAKMVLVVGVMPWLWSAAVWLACRKDAMPDDRLDKGRLLMMLAPVVIGLCVAGLGAIAPATITLPAPTGLDFEGASPWVAQGVSAIAAPVRPDLWGPVLALLAGIYGLVVLRDGLRLAWAQLRLHRIASQSRTADGLWGQGVRVSQASVPAFAWQRASIILPQGLINDLTPAQIDMLIRHERAHLRRGDTFYYAALSWIEVVLWFNPFVRSQAARCRVAAELACDAFVTDSHPEMRQAYAASLLRALKHTVGNALPCVPTVFSPKNSGEFRMRITEIMRPSASGRKPSRWIGLAAGLLLPLAGVQFAWSQGVAIEAPAKLMPVVDVAPSASIVPVDGHVSSGFGMRNNPVTHKYSMHDGVDITSAIGTDVRTPFDGRVTRADLSQPGYGKVLEIDHGNGLVTRYMHLGEFTVSVGDHVSAGQVVAKSGNTGLSTGPHTHIGVFKNGKAVDPAGVLTLPKG